MALQVSGSFIYTSTMLMVSLTVIEREVMFYCISCKFFVLFCFWGHVFLTKYNFTQSIRIFFKVKLKELEHCTYAARLNASSI